MIILLLMIFSVLLNSQCTHQISKELFQNDYMSFYRNTERLRRKETSSVFFTEQKSIVDFERQLIFVGYADESLKHANPVSRRDLLENTIIDMVRDENNLFCYDHEIVDAFLSNEIDVSELKQLLFIGYPNEEIKEMKKTYAFFALRAKKIKSVFTKDPVVLDTDACNAKGLPYGKGVLQKPGVSYREVNQDEYRYLSANDYPLAGFLLRSGNRIVNMLPNCAQGATQLLYGNAQYTKVSQLVEDRRNLFVKIDAVDTMQIGDCIAVLWDRNADAKTNSGHTGVVIDIDYDMKGSVVDGSLIEFFPANHAPRLVKISRSMYPAWRHTINSPAEEKSVYLMRAGKYHVPNYDFITGFLKQKYPEKKSFVVF